MAVSNLKIEKSSEVASLSEVCEFVVPTSGKDVLIREFYGSAAFSPNAVVKLVWDLGGAGEELIWSIKGESKMPFQKLIPKADVDGVKKLSVCLENTGTGAVYLSGYVEFSEQD